jgi:hypothetical protein
VTYPRKRFVPPPNSGIAYTCFNCHLFLTSQYAKCEGCGYDHGAGVHSHPAVEVLTNELWNVRKKRERERDARKKQEGV